MLCVCGGGRGGDGGESELKNFLIQKNLIGAHGDSRIVLGVPS